MSRDLFVPCDGPDCTVCNPPTDTDIDAAIAAANDRLHRKD